MGVFAWCSVGVAWYLVTRGFHPDTSTAVRTTASLVASFAIAAYIDHLVLRPRLKRLGYAAGLVVVMLIMTAVALSGARWSYRSGGHVTGPVMYHYAIDLIGMMVHIAGTSFVVWLWRGLFGLSEAPRAP